MIGVFVVVLTICALSLATVSITVVKSLRKSLRTQLKPSALLFRQLKFRFGFRVTDEPPEARGFIDGHEVTVTDEEIESVHFMRVTLKGECFLPAPLRMGKRSEILAGEDKLESVLRVGEGDFDDLNRSIGRPVLNDKVAGPLAFLREKAFAFSIHNGLISLLLPLDSAGGAVSGDVIAAAARLASRFHEIRRRTDLGLHVLCDRALNVSDRHERKGALKLLIAHYRNEELARRTLEKITESSDFKLGLLAAEGLGTNLLSYLKNRLPAMILPEKIKAIAAFADREVAGKTEFFIDYFAQAKEPALRAAVVDSLAGAADARAAALVLAALADEAEEVKAAAVEAVAAAGGRDALGPLYRIIADASLSRLLRERAQVVSESVCRRRGLRPEGRLSLAEAPPGGNLSLAAEEKPADDDPKRDDAAGGRGKDR
jgi:hypothetical protein